MNSNILQSIVLSNVLTACQVISAGKEVLAQSGTLQVAQLHVDRVYMEVKHAVPCHMLKTVEYISVVQLLVHIVGTFSDSSDWELT